MEQRDSISISGYLCDNLVKEFGIISMYVDSPVKDPARHREMLDQLTDIAEYLNALWIDSLHEPILDTGD